MELDTATWQRSIGNAIYNSRTQDLKSRVSNNIWTSRPFCRECKIFCRPYCISGNDVLKWFTVKSITWPLFREKSKNFHFIMFLFLCFPEEIIKDKAINCLRPGPDIKNMIKLWYNVWPTDDQVSHWAVSCKKVPYGLSRCHTKRTILLLVWRWLRPLGTFSLDTTLAGIWIL